MALVLARGRYGFSRSRVLDTILSMCPVTDMIEENSHSALHSRFYHRDPTRTVNSRVTPTSSTSTRDNIDSAAFGLLRRSNIDSMIHRKLHISPSMATDREEEEAKGSSEVTLRMTRAAIDKIKELQKKRQDPGVGLRLLVSGGGCSGFQYMFEIDNAVEEGDHILEEDGARVVCDEVSMNFVRGSTIDYESDLIQSKFIVSENPNAEIGCGCGSSFSVQMP